MVNIFPKLYASSLIYCNKIDFFLWQVFCPFYVSINH